MEKYEINREWPVTWEMNAAEYGRACQAIFDHIKSADGYETLEVATGPHNGIMFKGVELILKDGSDGDSEKV